MLANLVFFRGLSVSRKISQNRFVRRQCGSAQSRADNRKILLKTLLLHLQEVKQTTNPNLRLQNYENR